MIYTIETKILAEKSKILVKEKDGKYFSYMSLRKIQKLLEEKKEIFSMGYDQALNKILSIEFVGLQDFYEIKTFSGSKVILGIDCEVYIDGEWVKIEEIVFHEKIYVYDILGDVFRDTYITYVGSSGNYKAYRVEIEKEFGIIVNNLFVRFYGDDEDF
ncbi:MAG: hypothetical protein FWG98_07885 [Candidatus Cloacimonetes bacterium]|nr:hypothetical protein [Candidatus Cloacimonadota bacterium]